VTAATLVNQDRRDVDWPGRLIEFGFAELANQDYQPVRLSQLEVQNHPVWVNVGQELGIALRGLCVLPLTWRDGRGMGLFLIADLPGGEVSQANQAQMVQLAMLTCMAIENEILGRAEQIARQAAETLRVANLALTQELNLDAVLETLLDYMSWVVPYDSASVLLLDENKIPQVKTYRSYDPLTADSRHAAPAGLAAMPSWVMTRMLEKKQSLFVEDTREQVGWSDPTSKVGYSWMGIPLVSDGVTLGFCIVEISKPGFFTEDHLRLAEALAAQAVIAVENAVLFEGLELSNKKLSMAYDATIEGWARALELRHQETEGHSRRVTELTLELGRVMGMNEAELVHVRRGALLHDVGKMGIPDAILLKPAPLTDKERKDMQKHAQYAYDMLQPISYLQPALDIPYCHHEKWDGSGYPRGLKGEEIPLAARIFAVADVWDALTSDRNYSQAWSVEKVCDYLRDQAGQHFDPQIVETFLTLYPK
jgi:putative nucleotidyltransferase with HDIG domain